MQMGARPRVRVYLCDDDDDMHVLVREWLRDDDALEYVGGRQTEGDAFKEIAELDPDVILLDHRMPGSLSLEATIVRLRELAHARIVLFSGYQADHLRTAKEESGADGFVTKASGPQELCARLRALGQHAKR